MANISTSWTTVKKLTITKASANITFYLQAKYSSQNSSVYPAQTTGFQTRLRSVVNSGSLAGSGYKFTCTYCTTRSGSGVWTFDTETIISSSSKTITHNADGSKSLTLTATVKNTYWDIDEELTGVAVLPTVSGAAVTTNVKLVLDGDDVDSFNDTQSSIIYFSNPNNYTVYPYLNLYDDNGNIIHQVYRDSVGISSPYEWNLTEVEKNGLKAHANQKTTYRINCGVVSYNGETEMGHHSLRKEYNIVSANPDYTYTQSEENPDITGTKLINNRSQYKLTIKPTAKKGATISNIVVTSPKQRLEQTPTPTINDGKYKYKDDYDNVYWYDATNNILYDNSNNVVTISLDSLKSQYEDCDFVFNINNYDVGSNNFGIKEVDSRGNAGPTWVITRTVDEYQLVSIDTLSITRTTATSSSLDIQASVTYYGTTENNSYSTTVGQLNPTVEWMVAGGSWATLTSGYSYDNNHTLTINTTVNSTLDYQHGANVYLRITDKYSSTTLYTYVRTSVPTFDAGENDFNINGDLSVCDSSGDDKRYLSPFRVGDSYTFTARLDIGGFISSSSASVYTTIFLPRQMGANVTPSITGGQTTLRGINGYIDGTNANPIAYDDVAYEYNCHVFGDNAISLQLHKKSGTFLNTVGGSSVTVTNNTPVAFMIENLKITFTSSS